MIPFPLMSGCDSHPHPPVNTNPITDDEFYSHVVEAAKTDPSLALVLKQAALGNWQKETTILAAEHVLVMEYSELREQMMERLGEKISIPIAVACACKPLD